MKPIFILLVFFFLGTCSNKNEVRQSADAYPIDFCGEKILEFTKPFTLPNGITLKKDTFLVYSLANNGADTIWVKTVPNLDSLSFVFKDKSIKVLLMNKISSHRIKDNQWILSSDGNGLWGNYNDSIRLLPDQKIFFHRGRKNYKSEYDSIRFDIHIIKMVNKTNIELVLSKIISGL